MENNDGALEQYGKKREGISGFTFFLTSVTCCLFPLVLLCTVCLHLKGIIQTSRSDALGIFNCKCEAKMTKSSSECLKLKRLCLFHALLLRRSEQCETLYST